MKWESETLFNKADSFYFSVISEISKAQSSVDIETYIFESGRLTDEIFLSLREVMARGVQVRLLVDGVGSWLWLSTQNGLPAGVQLRSYHPVWRPRGLNRRDHKKVIVIDKQKAFVGSLNLTDKSFLWRETGLFVTGEEVKKIALAFEKIWSRSRHSSKISQLTRLPLSIPSRLFHSDLLIFNHSYRLRFRSHRYWLKLLRQTQTRLWMTTPYFVPTFRQQAALSSLAERGVDVRIIIPKQSDLPWMMPLSYFFLNKLIKKGARVYEFLPQILHAKTLLIDEQAFVGTSNWNHRSWLWDLEIDVAITHDENLKNMQQQFLNDLGCSRLISSPSSLPRFLLHFIVARLLWLFRRFL